MKILNTRLYIALFLGFILLNGCGKTENPSSPEGDKINEGINSLKKSGGGSVSGLVSWWPGDGNGNDVVGGQTVMAQGSATFGAAKVEQGFKMISGGDAFHAPDSPIWHLQQLTISAWVMGTAATGSGTPPDELGGWIITKVLLDFPHVAPYNSWVLSYQPATGQFSAIVQPAWDSGYLKSATGFAAGEFHHVAMTYDGTTLKLYVNGIFQGEKVAPGPIQYSDKHLGIGAHAFGDFPFDRTLIGEVDEVQIYNRALSVDEIHAIYNDGEKGKDKTPRDREVPIFNSANGHYYQAVSVPEGITWDDALVEAYAMKFLGCQGHLAVITSQEENDFIVSNFPQAMPGYAAGFWLGGFQQQPSSASNEGWIWITGEPWVFTKWGFGEPNDSNVLEEDALHFHWWGGYPNGDWNDNARSSLISGYVVEYEHHVEVTICHKPGTSAQKTMVIPVQSLPGHLRHGDIIGSCE